MVTPEQPYRILPSLAEAKYYEATLTILDSDGEQDIGRTTFDASAAAGIGGSPVALLIWCEIDVEYKLAKGRSFARMLVGIPPDVGLDAEFNRLSVGALGGDSSLNFEDSTIQTTSMWMPLHNEKFDYKYESFDANGPSEFANVKLEVFAEITAS